MKTKIIMGVMLIAAACGAYAQQSDYKVVFDLTSPDSVNQQSVIRQVELIRKENPLAKLEVVVYGQGLGLVNKDQSKHAAAITRLTADPNTSFKVCAVTMKRYNIDESMLVAGVKVVPDGIYEIISKQKEGWGYIKVAH